MYSLPIQFSILQTWTCCVPSSSFSPGHPCSLVYLRIRPESARDGSSPPPPFPRTVHGQLSFGGLLGPWLPPLAARGRQGGWERRPTPSRDGLPLHERAGRAIPRWEPRAGGKRAAFARGKPRDQGTSRQGRTTTAMETRRSGRGTNRLVRTDAEWIADDERKRRTERRWIF